MIELILFDAGDTVLRDVPQYAGPMVSWPTLEVMPGVEEALRTLGARYRLAIASNAAASTPEQIQGALARVRLDRYFAHAFTARDLGVSKPDPLFFDAVLAACGTLPHRAVMVGDSFRTDVVGAKLAGLWAVWYNPQGAAAPTDIPLSADAEIRALADLPAAVDALARRAGRSV